jgi:hypothetical protein
VSSVIQHKIQGLEGKIKGLHNSIQNLEIEIEDLKVHMVILVIHMVISSEGCLSVRSFLAFFDKAKGGKIVPPPSITC